MISNSPSQLRITAPIFTIVEAKNDNIKSGIPQCMAEMIAAQIFNLQQNNQISCIYGCVTTGSNWKFMKLVEKTIYIDSMEYFISNLDLLLGILTYIIDTTKNQSKM